MKLKKIDFEYYAKAKNVFFYAGVEQIGNKTSISSSKDVDIFVGPHSVLLVSSRKTKESPNGKTVEVNNSNIKGSELLPDGN